MTFRHADAPTFVIPENVPVHKLLSYFLTEQMVQREPLKAWDFYFMSRRKGFYLCHAERDFIYVTQKGIFILCHAEIAEMRRNFLKGWVSPDMGIKKR